MTADRPETMQHIFETDAWAKFAYERQNLVPKDFTFGNEAESDTAFGRLRCYVNEKGKLRQPELMPFCPAFLRNSPTPSQQRIDRQRLEISSSMAEQMARTAFSGAVTLASELSDVRPWQWNGMVATPRYTYLLETQSYDEYYSKSVKKNIAKSERAGYEVRKIHDPETLIRCLAGSEERAGFSYGLTVQLIDLLHRLLGDDRVRTYIGYTSTGEPATARLVLRVSESLSLDWIAGTLDSHLRSGVTQQVIAFALDDFAHDGVTRFDYGGANNPPVAAAKAEWGGKLAQHFVVESQDLRSLSKQIFRFGRKALKR